MESAMESIVTGIGTCGFYEAIYISLTTESVAKLGDSLVDLYAAIIVFCVRAAKHIESSGIGKMLMNEVSFASAGATCYLTDILIRSICRQDTRKYQCEVEDLHRGYQSEGESNARIRGDG